jgi:hypothetical protein
MAEFVNDWIFAHAPSWFFWLKHHRKQSLSDSIMAQLVQVVEMWTASSPWILSGGTVLVAAAVTLGSAYYMYRQ